MLQNLGSGHSYNILKIEHEKECRYRHIFRIYYFWVVTKAGHLHLYLFWEGFSWPFSQSVWGRPNNILKLCHYRIAKPCRLEWYEEMQGAGLTGLPRKIAEDCEPTPLGTLRSAYYLCEVACTLLHLIGSCHLSAQAHSQKP